MRLSPFQTFFYIIASCLIDQTVPFPPSLKFLLVPSCVLIPLAFGIALDCMYSVFDEINTISQITKEKILPCSGENYLTI